MTIEGCRRSPIFSTGGLVDNIHDKVEVLYSEQVFPIRGYVCLKVSVLGSTTSCLQYQIQLETLLYSKAPRGACCAARMYSLCANDACPLLNRTPRNFHETINCLSIGWGSHDSTLV